MRTVLQLLFFAIVSLGSFQPAFACKCVSWGKPNDVEIKATIIKEFNESASVFTGEVVDRDMLTVKFRIMTMWKGDAFEELTLSTGTEKLGEDLYRTWGCHYSFKVGEKYLVYARWNTNNQIVAEECARTTVLSSELPDLQELDILNPRPYHAPMHPAQTRMPDPALKP